jgi:hypothetical protein
MADRDAERTAECHRRIHRIEARRDDREKHIVQPRRHRGTELKEKLIERQNQKTFKSLSVIPAPAYVMLGQAPAGIQCLQEGAGFRVKPGKTANARGRRKQ